MLYGLEKNTAKPNNGLDNQLGTSLMQNLHQSETKTCNK